MADRFLHRRLDDEEIVVDLEKGEFYGLNPTATRILELWRGGVREPVQIALRLVEEFEVGIEEAEVAVRGLLEEARAVGWLGDDGA